MSCRETDDPLGVLRGGAVRRRARARYARRPGQRSSSATGRTLSRRSTRRRSGARVSRTSAAATRGWRRVRSRTSTTSSTTRHGPSSSSRTRARVEPSARAGPIGHPRATRRWDVPEPEIGLVLDADGTILAHTIGNDVSSREIEGANPLYLSQAKIYRRAGARSAPRLVAGPPARGVRDQGSASTGERASRSTRTRRRPRGWSARSRSSRRGSSATIRVRRHRPAHGDGSRAARLVHARVPGQTVADHGAGDRHAGRISVVRASTLIPPN